MVWLIKLQLRDICPQLLDLFSHFSDNPIFKVGKNTVEGLLKNTPFFSRWMEFLKIDGDTAKTKKTPFVAKNSRKSGGGVVLHSLLF